LFNGEKNKMRVRTNIKAGGLIQDVSQRAEDIVKEINHRLNKPRVSVSGWGDVRGSQDKNA
jgi:hypothetical protein